MTEADWKRELARVTKLANRALTVASLALGGLIGFALMHH